MASVPAFTILVLIRTTSDTVSSAQATPRRKAPQPRHLLTKLNTLATRWIPPNMEADIRDPVPKGNGERQDPPVSFHVNRGEGIIEQNASNFRDL